MFPFRPAAVPQESFIQGSLTSLHTNPMHHNAVSQQLLREQQYTGTVEPLFKQHRQEIARQDVSGQCLGIKPPSHQAFSGDTLLHSDDVHATRQTLQNRVHEQQRGGYHHDPTCTVKTLSHQVTSNSSQDLRFTVGAMKRDVSFVRKLRQRERSYHGNWRFAEQIHGKRSQEFMEEDSVSLPPCKQFVSEEKMAARMGNLSITNDGLATLQERWSQARQKAKRQMEEIESRLSDSESDEEAKTSFKEKEAIQQLKVSPELKAALSRQEGAIPQSIVQSMLNPCTQLVLWKPPVVYLPDAIKSSSDQGQAKTDLRLATIVNSTLDLNPNSESSEMEVKPTQAMPGIARLIGTQGDAAELFDCIDDEMDL